MNLATINVTRAVTWWDERSQREQAMIAVAAALVIVLVLVAGVWRPLHSMRAAARADIRTYDTLMAHIRVAGPELARRPAPRRGSAATFIANSASQFGLTIQRFDPEQGRVRIVLQDADFVGVMRWLEGLERDGRVSISEVKLERTAAPGLVNAQIALSTG